MKINHNNLGDYMIRAMEFQNIPSEAIYASVQGTITNISSVSQNGCVQLFELKQANGQTTTFTVFPQTYFINGKKAEVGMTATFYYDITLPAPLIYPPRYAAVAAVVGNVPYNVKIDYFDENLLSLDGSLHLNPSRETDVILQNGQSFIGTLGNQNLIVLYTSSTRSIPAQTTPETIIILCPLF